MSRIILSALLFLAIPAHAESAIEESCKKWAQPYLDIAEARDAGRSPWVPVWLMVSNWENYDDDDKKWLLRRLVLVFDVHKDKKPQDIFDEAVAECLNNNGA